MLVSENSVADLPLTLTGVRFFSEKFVKKSLFPLGSLKIKLILQKFEAVVQF